MDQGSGDRYLFGYRKWRHGKSHPCKCGGGRPSSSGEESLESLLQVASAMVSFRLRLTLIDIDSCQKSHAQKLPNCPTLGFDNRNVSHLSIISAYYGWLYVTPPVYLLVVSIFLCARRAIKGDINLRFSRRMASGGVEAGAIVTDRDSLHLLLSTLTL